MRVILNILLLLIILAPCAKAQELFMDRGIFIGEMTYYEDQNKISKSEVTELMQSNPVALDHWDKANLYHKISIGGMVTQFAFTFWTFRQLNNLETSYIPIYIMVAATIPTIAFDFMSRNSRKNALLQYNAGLSYQPRIEIGPTEYGIGMLLKF